MLNLITTLRTRAAQRALYRRTRDALAGLPPSVARDLGITPDNTDLVARRAVWG